MLSFLVLSFLDETSLVAQMIKCLPTMWETLVRSLGQEDPLEKEMATHCSILARNILGQKSLVGYGPWGHKKSDPTEAAEHSTAHLLIAGQLYIPEPICSSVQWGLY